MLEQSFSGCEAAGHLLMQGRGRRYWCLMTAVNLPLRRLVAEGKMRSDFTNYRDTQSWP
jgi:hypothetical protein